MDFMETNYRNPTRHRIDEHLLLNFIKHNRELLNAGYLKERKVETFENLLTLGTENRHVNQHK